MCTELVRPELASYQFPVDDDEQTTIKNKPNLMKQPSVSALKKSNNDPNVRSTTMSSIIILL